MSRNVVVLDFMLKITKNISFPGPYSSPPGPFPGPFPPQGHESLETTSGLVPRGGGWATEDSLLHRGRLSFHTLPVSEGVTEGGPPPRRSRPPIKTGPSHNLLVWEGDERGTPEVPMAGRGCRVVGVLTTQMCFVHWGHDSPVVPTYTDTRPGSGNGCVVKSSEPPPRRKGPWLSSR